MRFWLGSCTRPVLVVSVGGAEGVSIIVVGWGWGCGGAICTWGQDGAGGRMLRGIDVAAETGPLHRQIAPCSRIETQVKAPEPGDQRLRGAEVGDRGQVGNAPGIPHVHQDGREPGDSRRPHQSGFGLGGDIHELHQAPVVAPRPPRRSCSRSARTPAGGKR